MKVLILGGSSSRNSGGVFETARMMGLQLYERNKVHVEYLMYDDEYSAEDRIQYGPLPVHSYTIKGPRKLGFSTDLYKHMRNIQPDIVHTQSLWMYLSNVNRKYNKRTGTPYIISPHGMLDKWQLHQSFWKNLKKNIVLRLYEQEHMKKTACFHALCQEEHDAIRALGFTNPIAIIPNGIELPQLNNTENCRNTLVIDINTRKKLLYLGRIHPKKGLDNLLEAWAYLNPDQHNWQLVIAGETKDENYMQSLRKKATSLEIDNTVDFVGGQFGDNRHRCFVNSHAFILPSFSEGLPMSVLEAWSYKLPALITPQCNLPDGYKYNAAIHIEPSVESIRDGLRKLMAMHVTERSQMGQRGFKLAAEKFSWPQVAQSMTWLYKWVLGQANKPDFVHTIEK